MKTFKSANYVVLTFFLSLLISGCFSTENQVKQETKNAPELLNSTEQTVTTKLSSEELDPKVALLEQLLQQANLYEENKQSLSLDQKTFMQKALLSFKRSEHAKGLSFIEQAEQLGGINSASYVLKADLFKATGDFESYRENLKRALTINKYNAKAANRLALLHRENGEFDKALALYDQAINSVPSHAPSYRNRAVLKDLYLFNKTEALEDYQRYAVLINASDLAEQDKIQKRQSKMVKRWIVDLERQVQTLARQANED